MKWQILLISLLILSSISLVSAEDIEVAFPCGGDEQATFLCFGDEQLNFWGVIKRAVREVAPSDITIFNIFEYPNYIYLIIGILVFLLVILLLILLVKRRKKKDL